MIAIPETYMHSSEHGCLGLSGWKIHHAIMCAIFGLAVCADMSLAQESPPCEKFPRIGRTSPDSFVVAERVHDGVGTIHYQELLNWRDVQTNFLFMRTAIVPPGASIGEHRHTRMEEMFISLDGPLTFSVNGRRAAIKSRTMVLCPAGSSHGIYNHTDKPVRVLEIAVSMDRGAFDATDLGDDLTACIAENPVPFRWENFDRGLLPKTGAPAHLGKGLVHSRLIWNNESFATNWLVVTHAVLPPGSSIGYHQHNTREEFIYVNNGRGRATVADSTFVVSPGMVFPCRLHESHGIYNPTDVNIELLLFSVTTEKGVVRDEKNLGDDLSGR